MPKHNRLTWIYFIIGIPLYFLIHYSLKRDETPELLTVYTLLFLVYIFIYRKINTDKLFRTALLFAILYRLLLIPGFPTLSDDIYRFIWDGLVIQNGMDPFGFTPTEILAKHLPGLDQNLYSHLNSPDYHSVYPPVLQGIFFLSVNLFSDSWIANSIFLRSILLIGELFSILLLMKIARISKLNQKVVLLYALNPLVILELTGNLHFEALMIPFILFSFLLLQKKKYFSSGVSLAAGIGVKLLPALLIPFYLIRRKFKPTILWLSGLTLISAIIFFPIITTTFTRGIGAGLLLYFQKFEFNASIYYLVREVGFMAKGYNIIGTAGPVLALITFLFILGLAYLAYKKRISLIECFLWAFVIYLLFTSIIHPWYVIPILAISVLTEYKFPLVWSFFIFMTYSGYSFNQYNESTLVVFVEYFFTFGFAAWELWKNYGKKLQT